MYLNYDRRKPRRWPWALLALVVVIGAAGYWIVQNRPDLIPADRLRDLPLPAPVQAQVQSRVAQVIPPTITPVPTVRVDHLARLLGGGGVVQINQRVAVHLLVEDREVRSNACDIQHRATFWPRLLPAVGPGSEFCQSF